MLFNHTPKSHLFRIQGAYIMSVSSYLWTYLETWVLNTYTVSFQKNFSPDTDAFPLYFLHRALYSNLKKTLGKYMICLDEISSPVSLMN